LELLVPNLRRVSLQEVEAAGALKPPIPALYFVESGILIEMMETRGRSMATGIVGPEGATGVMFAIGGYSPPQLRAMLPGTALELPIDVARKLVAANPDILRTLLSYVYQVLLEYQESALLAVVGDVQARVAHCLLAIFDRTGADELVLRHSDIAASLGVRRASVTVALHYLEGEHLVKSLRKRLILRDRDGLAAVVDFGSSKKRSSATQDVRPLALHHLHRLEEAAPPLAWP